MPFEVIVNQDYVVSYHVCDISHVIAGIYFRSLQGNNLTGRIPEVIGLMQALAVL